MTQQKRITDYVPPPTGEAFMKSNAKVRLIMGPVGCLHPDTLVVTEEGAIPISRIDRPMRVLSWNEKTCRFQLSWCGTSFRKGTDYLYRVVTPQGEFDASGSHLLLCADGEYRRVQDLQVGDVLAAGSPFPLVSVRVAALRAWFLSVRRWTQKVVDCLGGYVESARRYGQQLLQVVGIAQFFAPLRVGAQEYAQRFYQKGTLHTDVLRARGQLRTRLFRFFDRRQTKRCVVQTESAPEVWVGQGVLVSSAHAEDVYQEFRRSLVSFSAHRLIRLLRGLRQLFLGSWAYISPLNRTNRSIIAITRKQVKEDYWDIQVAETHNYVTIDGAIHHNSGKSTVSMVEVFRQCVEMPKCKDGFRRSRWAFVRNTNQQLKQTTWKTWVQWFPPGVVGTWKESDKTFYLEIGDIRAEILFLPLDTPDDAQRLLSLELTGVFFNEAREIPPELITAALARTGRYPSRNMLPIDPATGKPIEYRYGMIMDTNPPGRDSWLYKTFEEDKPEGWEIFKQPGGLEPNAENRENLPPTYYEDMMHGATEDWINVHVHGKYGRSLSGRPVYEKTFIPSFHIAEKELVAINSSTYPIIIGMDFGRTPAAVIGQRDWRGRVNVLDALYEENVGLENFLNLHLKPLLTRKYPHNKFIVIGDPAGWAKSQLSEENAFDILKRCGFTARRAPTNDINKRIQAVEHLLAQQVEGKAMMLFSPASTSPGMKHLLSGLEGGYKYKRKKDGSYDVTPEKDHYSHDNDALQYFALGINMGGGAQLGYAQRREIVRVSAAGWT